MEVTPPHAQCRLVDHLTTVGGGRRGGSTDTRTPGTQSVREPGTQRIVGPVVDDRVPATTAHSQPVACYPDQLDMLEVPDGRVEVAEDRDEVKRQPAERVDDHH